MNDDDLRLSRERAGGRRDMSIDLIDDDDAQDGELRSSRKVNQRELNTNDGAEIGSFVIFKKISRKIFPKNNS
jgi:hypothetical protein